MVDPRRDADTPSAHRAVFLVDTARGSYAKAAELYAVAFEAAGIDLERHDLTAADLPDLRGRWVVHHTIGPLYRPIAGAHNTAVVFHEWSRYPAGWLATLNSFESVWAPSRHVEETLAASGLTSTLAYVPPPLSFDTVPTRTTWAATEPFRFLAVGEVHFRKGLHLLLAGYLKAFPEPGVAELTLKVPASCDWNPPRTDIRFIRERLAPDAMARLYTEHDALVTASLGEGLGLPLAEAVDALLPVVVNLWGGHRDIVSAEGCWPIGFDEVPQLFCSAPAFFAPEQRCAYSSPDRIAAALLDVARATSVERERRARLARASMRNAHSVDEAARRIRQNALLH